MAIQVRIIGPVGSGKGILAQRITTLLSEDGYLVENRGEIAPKSSKQDPEIEITWENT